MVNVWVVNVLQLTNMRYAAMYFELAHCLDGLGQTRQSSIVALKQEKKWDAVWV